MKKTSQVQSLKKISQHLNILYVEDNDDLRESTKKLFLKFFKRVDTASNGKDGLNLYQNYLLESQEYYDIVISDIQMPYLDGIDMSKAIH